VSSKKKQKRRSIFSVSLWNCVFPLACVLAGERKVMQEFLFLALFYDFYAHIASTANKMIRT